MNVLKLHDINGARGVYHEICHDIFMSVSMYALEFVPTGFQIYSLKIIIKHPLFSKVVPRKGNVGKCNKYQFGQ